MKKVWLERNFNGSSGTNSSSSTPFALIELASNLVTTAVNAIVTVTISTGQVVGNFRLLYADLFLLSQDERLAWKGNLISESCQQASALSDAFCARPDPAQAKPPVLDMAMTVCFTPLGSSPFKP